MQKRLKFLALIFLTAFFCLLARLFYWQIIKAKEISAQAKRQYQTGRSLDAPRGNILASDSTWLAGRKEGWLVYASLPDLDSDTDFIADKLAPLFTDKESDNIIQSELNEANRLKNLLTKSSVVWVNLKDRVDSETKSNVEVLNIAGIGFEPQELRAYPESSVASHLLGFVGKNKEGYDQGYFGLEGYYDLVLSGKPGFMTRESDAKGIPILLQDEQEVNAQSGVALLTHIDKGIQISIEDKLKKGIEKYGAKGGTVIVINPKNGAIYAMSSYPQYDPEKYYEFENEDFKNSAISNTFEPGSVFKVVVMASALDAKVVEPDTRCDMCGGPLRVDKYSIETWNNQYFPDSTMTDVIVHSDNVGMSFVGQKLGSDRLYDYLKKFGIGELTEIDLQGEVAPKLREKGTWNIVDLSTAGFGQGVALTPIELVRAVGAIANKGVLVKPQVVDKLIGEGWQEDIQPVMGDKIISEDSASKVTAMMVEAAKSGEAKWTHLRGFKVAGKTGTAQIPIQGHYDSDKTIASFIGFAPFDNPKFLMLVTLLEPQSSPWASETAAPLWYDLAKDLFMHFGIQPEKSE